MRAPRVPTSRIDLSVSRPATGHFEPSTPTACRGRPSAVRVCPLTNVFRTARTSSRGLPEVENVGGTFLVVTRSAFHLAEPVPLIKPLRPEIRLEGPEPQALRARALCQPDQLAADATPGQSRFDVELLEPVFIEYQEANQRAAIVLGYPKLGVSYDPLRNPAPYFVIGVRGHRDRGLRSLAGAEVETRHRNCIPVCSPAKLKVHPMMIPVSKTNLRSAGSASVEPD